MQIPKKEIKKTQGRRRPKIVRISEEVQDVEWPRERDHRSLRNMESDGQRP